MTPPDPAYDTTETIYPAVDNLEVLRAAHNYNRFLRREIIRHSRGAKTVLDFGAGDGLFPLALREMGVQVSCLEPDPGLRARLKVLGFEVYARIDEIAPASLDYIYSLNVLEHIIDDLGILKQLYLRLKPGGRLFLYVPAFNILFSSMDRKVGHVRRYRRTPAIQLLQLAGFEVLQAMYADSLGFIATLLYKYFGNRKGDLNPKAIKIYDSIAFPVSRVCDRVFRGCFGKNLMITSRRPSD